MWIAGAPEPSAPRMIGPIPPTSPAAGPSTTAPTPSPNSGAVRLSSQSTIRVVKSAPISSTRSARPVSIWAAPSDRPDRKPVQAAPRSIAPARSAPTAWATIGAAFGINSSCVSVAINTRSTSAASTPARFKAATPARAANSDSRSPGAATGRARMPVRDTIQSSLTPSRSASSAVVTVPEGTSDATERIAGRGGSTSDVAA